MKDFKKRLLRSFFALEVLLFICIYFFGAHGLSALQCLKKQNKVLMKEIVDIKKEIYIFEQELNQWNSYESYKKEKYAREKLQMARTHEEIYII